MFECSFSYICPKSNINISEVQIIYRKISINYTIQRKRRRRIIYNSYDPILLQPNVQFIQNWSYFTPNYNIGINKLSHPNKCLLISFKRSKTINFPPTNERTFRWNGYGKAKCLLPVCFPYVNTQKSLCATLHLIASNRDKSNDKRNEWKHHVHLYIVWAQGKKLSGLTLQIDGAKWQQFVFGILLNSIRWNEAFAIITIVYIS